MDLLILSWYLKIGLIPGTVTLVICIMAGVHTLRGDLKQERKIAKEISYRKTEKFLNYAKSLLGYLSDSPWFLGICLSFTGLAIMFWLPILLVFLFFAHVIGDTPRRGSNKTGACHACA